MTNTPDNPSILELLSLLNNNHLHLLTVLDSFDVHKSTGYVLQLMDHSECDKEKLRPLIRDQILISAETIVNSDLDDIVKYDVLHTTYYKYFETESLRAKELFDFIGLFFDVYGKQTSTQLKTFLLHDLLAIDPLKIDSLPLADSMKYWFKINTCLEKIISNVAEVKNDDLSKLLCFFRLNDVDRLGYNIKNELNFKLTYIAEKIYGEQADSLISTAKLLGFVTDTSYWKSALLSSNDVSSEQLNIQIS